MRVRLWLQRCIFVEVAMESEIKIKRVWRD